MRSGSLNVCICGPRASGKLTGVSLAVELFIDGLKKREIGTCVIDTTRGSAISRAGAFSLARAYDTMVVIVSVWSKLVRCDVYYATMSTSPLGFIRDYLTVGFAKLFGRRTVLHLHGGGFEDFYTSARPWLQSLIRSNLKKTDTIIVLGELLKDQFYCAGEFVKEKLVVVPNGLTLGVEEPDLSSRELTQLGPIQLLYLSSLMPSKGFFDVIQAMGLLEKEHPGRFHFNLCGSFVDAKTETPVEVADEASLRCFIDSNGLSKCITYHGQVSGDEKTAMFQKADLFLLPTSYPWEGQPLSIIEALAYGVPVISTNHKGIPEQVVDGETGYFVKPHDPRDIAMAVVRSVEGRNAYTEMSRKARTHYEAIFRREVHLERLISVILHADELS